MKIRNEPQRIAETIQSILNWNDIYIGVHSKNGIVESFRQHLKSLNRDNRSKCCIILNLRNVHHGDHQQQRQRQRRRQRQQQRKLITYLLYKLTQLCFVIVLLLPFLITYNTLIQQVSGQYINIDPISTSISNSNAISFQINQSIDLKAEFQTEQHHNNSYKNNERNNHITNKNSYPIYTYNHRLNGYSLIILSQSDNYINSRVADTRIPSTKPDSILYANDSLSSILRTKRYIDINNNNRREHKADSQILKVSFEKHKDTNNNNKMYKQIINNKEKLTKLVMNGLGLKKLPDMKKANISQIEYSSKYLEYLERLKKSEVRKSSENPTDSDINLQILSIVTNKFSEITRRRKRKRSAERRKRKSRERREKKTFRKSQGHNLGDSERTNILLHFPLRLNDEQFKYEQINEANVRLMMLYNPALAVSSRSESISRGNRRKINNKSEKDCNNNDNYRDIPKFNHNQNHNQKLSNRKSKVHVLNLKVYQMMRMNKRQQLDARRIEFESSNYRLGNSDETRSQWIEFDVTAAVRAWLNKSHENLGIEIQCDKCRRIGARILSEVSTPTSTAPQDHERVEDKFHLTPVLNIIGHIGRTHSEEAAHPNHYNLSSNTPRYYNHRQANSMNNSPNSCYRARQRCCRHQLDVAFKDIEGFEFILQPKTFDAGFCKGRCPPRHNPAHHHALLQSLIWQQDHNRVPRPCCAPSKLTEVEILHVDEEHSDKLKISTWSNMQVLECACS
ncbi:putative uncharacterized protein DDB_G0286901 [Drosophila innubila]|uniref:putative uncharacterized protein DDB_G0286901 n=1 Tax=Drosophila innubila TaxID=198719 RepID=UPI00148DD818|nr:putative uncharacterized protein DDB_G0286901 [Drosophila innubila]